MKETQEKTKSKILNALLIITSLMGYLEWSGDSHAFLFEAEAEILSRLFTEPASVLHPFVVFPLIGQLILLITLFQKTPNKAMTFISMAGLGLLLGFMFVIGLISLNGRIVLSTVPFLLIAVLTILHYRRIKKPVGEVI